MALLDVAIAVINAPLLHESSMYSVRLFAKQDFGHCLGDLPQIERLGQDLINARGKRLLREDRPTVSANQNHRNIGPPMAHLPRQLGARQSRHDLIEHDYV